MMALALLDTSTKVGRRVSAALPEYFSETQVKGKPVAFRILVEMSIKREEINEPGSLDATGHLYLGEICDELGIPYLHFNTWGNAKEGEIPSENAPPEIMALLDSQGNLLEKYGKEAGAIVEYREKHFVVMYVYAPVIFLIPLEFLPV